MEGRIQSVYAGSGVDGKGLRVVVFFYGCNLRCPFCHNPETLYGDRFKVFSDEEVVAQIKKYKSYIKRGGVTLSGGEPFYQAEFAKSIIKKLINENIPVIIETNGHIIDRELLALTEYVILDVKNQERDNTEVYDAFLTACESEGKRVEVTNVLVPGVNDGDEKISSLAALLKKHGIKEIRFLPFRKLSRDKYLQLKIPFGFAGHREAGEEDLRSADNKFSEYYQKCKS